MIIEDTLRVLLRDIPAESAIQSWINGYQYSDPLCIRYNDKLCHTSLMDKSNHYSVDDAEYALRYARNYDLLQPDDSKQYGVFGLVAFAVKDMLTTDIEHECLCKYMSLLDFRRLTHPIDPTIFVSAYLAQDDIQKSYNRNTFARNPTIRCNNGRLQNILSHGMAENHFHIGGSTNAFSFQWICLMNHLSGNRRNEFSETNIDSSPLSSHPSEAPLYPLIIKAAFIRYFLYCTINDISPFSNTNEENDLTIKDLLKMCDDEIGQNVRRLDTFTYSLRELCIDQEKNISQSFIPDYALYGEPIPNVDNTDELHIPCLAVRNYERMLYRPLAGEHRFQYSLFSEIFKKNPKIMPYIDLAYAYLLIYCRFRAEFVQVNNRVGFNNFRQYQDRKEIFTDKWPQYGEQRTQIAQQSVLANPHIISFEGRLGPALTADLLNIKLLKTLSLATTSSYVSPYLEHFLQGHRGNVSSTIVNLKSALDKQKLKQPIPATDSLALRTLENAQNKLSYTIHFPKRAQFISNDEAFELTNPRDSRLRKKITSWASAIIQARSKYPESMSWVTTIDACSSEIDCRPEVFAPEFRHMKYVTPTYDAALASPYVPPLRITYHVGEDFLDLIDGLRAIDEAIIFLDMQNGDRIGHAMALGIDCEEWYSFKGETIVLQKQVLLDNLVWLYGAMRKYNIANSGVEDHIRKWFKKLYTSIYIDNIDKKASTQSLLYNVGIDDYLSSLSLRGNDPLVYINNPGGSIIEQKHFQKALAETESEPWKLQKKAGKGYDILSNILYHCYHWDFGMKLESSKLVEYSVPYCVIDVICQVQEKMQYQISRKNIGIECNPSSNYLIGTFRDYLKHPIFRFDNKELYLPSDAKSKEPNPHICASINTDDLGIFDTSLENEYAIMASALEIGNSYCREGGTMLPQQIYDWLNHIRQNGCDQAFHK